MKNSLQMAANRKNKKLPGWAIFIIVAIIYVLSTGMVSFGIIDSYYAGIMNWVFIAIIAAVSLNLVTGLMGQLVLGHAGFMLIGAYTSAIVVNALQTNLYISLPISLLLGGVLASIVGLVIGIPALRLRGDYLAIITLGFGEIIKVFATNLDFITNGAQGYSGYPTFSTRTQPSGLFSITLAVAILVIFFSYTYGTSRYGRSVIAIREDEIAADANGINTTYYKLLTFVASAFFAGIAGGLQAQYSPIIDPSKFGFDYSVKILMMVVLGGMGSITGSVVAAVILSILPIVLVSFERTSMLIYSVILIVVMLFRPQGLLGRKEFHITKFLQFLKGGKKKKAVNKEAEK